MGIRKVLESLRDAIASDAGVTDWCNLYYSRGHKVFLGYNREQPPIDDDWPAVVIASVDFLESKLSMERHKITIGIYIGDESEDTSGNKITFAGFANSEELREVVEKAIVRNQKKIGKVEFEANTLETPLFPLFTAITMPIVEIISDKISIEG